MARAASDIASGRKAVGCLIDGKFIWEPPVIASVKYFLSEYHRTFLCQVLCIKMPRLRPREAKALVPKAGFWEVRGKTGQPELGSFLESPCLDEESAGPDFCKIKSMEA